MFFAKGVAKLVLVLGFAGTVSLIAIAPATAQINVDVPGLHVHVGHIIGIITPRRRRLITAIAATVAVIIPG